MTEERTTNVPHCHISVTSGEIKYEFEASSILSEGDVVSAYVEEFEIGSAAIESDCVTAKISLKNFPKVAFPATIRSIAGPKFVVLPTVMIENSQYLMNTVDFEASDFNFEVVSFNRVVCKATVYSMPLYSRPVLLFLGEKKICNADTQPVSSTSENDHLTHRIEFAFDRINLVDGDVLSVVDKISDAFLSKFEITTESLDKILANRIENQENEIKQLSNKIKYLEVKVNALSTFCTEGSIHERIDLFYYLLSSKVDKVLSGLAGFEQKRESDNLLQNYESDFFGEIIVPVNEIDGTGIYPVETTGSAEWRWLSPRVTILLKNFPKRATRLCLTFSSKMPENISDRLTIMVNDFAGHANYAQIEDSWEMEVLVSNYIKRPDGMLIVGIKFLDYWQADGDERLLSAALTQVRIA